ncbi:MAG: diacylglycerol kinase family protein [Patescibacteria group bacterium]|nr:diacylglycerol kinase family protein [Patescibacteria group bacterium]MDD5566669.1 diacylglycerol kinase family protein [Patescibacteria group bacterium]
MYVYLYDTFVAEPKWQSQIARIENRLTDLGIAGRICRLSILTSLEEIITEAIKKGADTIVAVGNDNTVRKVIPLVASQTVSFGIIPVGGPSRLAELLGIPEGEKACDVLSARVVERLDLGKVNEQYFLTQLEIPFGDLELSLDNQYTVRPLNPEQSITIYNLGIFSPKNSPENYKSNPRDGLLELVVSGGASGGLGHWFKKGEEHNSVFSLRTARINCPQTSQQSVIADGYTVVNTPVKIAVAPKRLKVVVGKNRAF